MYMPGRLRTGSSPVRTSISSALYVLILDLAVGNIQGPNSLFLNNNGQLNSTPLSAPATSMQLVGNDLIVFVGAQGINLINLGTGVVEQHNSLDFAMAGRSTANLLFVADSFGGLLPIQLGLSNSTPSIHVDVPSPIFEIAKGSSRKGI